jgi:hypothetical protein
MKMGRLMAALGLMTMLISACAPVSGQTHSTASSVFVMTPRGNELEATDPSTVNLSAGTPILVEFFRFT